MRREQDDGGLIHGKFARDHYKSTVISLDGGEKKGFLAAVLANSADLNHGTIKNEKWCPDGANVAIIPAWFKMMSKKRAPCSFFFPNGIE